MFDAYAAAIILLCVMFLLHMYIHIYITQHLFAVCLQIEVPEAELTEDEKRRRQMDSDLEFAKSNLFGGLFPFFIHFSVSFFKFLRTD